MLLGFSVPANAGYKNECGNTHNGLDAKRYSKYILNGGACSTKDVFLMKEKNTPNTVGAY